MQFTADLIKAFGHVFVLLLNCEQSRHMLEVVEEVNQVQCKQSDLNTWVQAWYSGPKKFYVILKP